MKQIAILGFGVVGAGIPAILEKNAESVTRAVGEPVRVKYILDLREFPDSPYGDRVIHDIAPILADPEIEVVCEAMGGSHPALEFSLRCLEAKKSVVTSNKEVVANFGDRLLAAAAANGVSYLFEASVGGGIPLIRPFMTSLACDRITEFCGIVNGTTNYILTKMREEGREFDDVLAEAQALGYAERDPSADIDGIDAKRKLAILTALATGILPENDELAALSLRGISVRDLEAASLCGGRLKLVARMRRVNEKIEAYVCPMIVPDAHPLAHVEGVYNAVSFTSPATGDILYYGRGAGRYPTAGALVSDAAAILSGAAAHEAKPVFRREAGAILPFSEVRSDFYIRASGLLDPEEALSAVSESVEVLSAKDGVCELVAKDCCLSALDAAAPGAVKIRILR